MTDSASNVVVLPEDFIGKEDEARLESFAAHLIACGAATRWHWHRSQGIDVIFDIYHGGRNESLLARIARDSSRDLFYAEDGPGRRIAEGSLERVMITVDAMARSMRPRPLA